MNEFDVLWIDDRWVDNNEDHLQFELLQETKNLIQMQNKNISFYIKNSIAESAITLLNREGLQFNLLIVDLMFEEDDNGIKPILKYAQEKLLPIIIFSNNVSNYKTNFFVPGIDKLIVGMYEKIHKEDLVNCVLNLSRFKSLNIVHISDFHYDSSLQGAALSEQKICFEHLKHCLIEENNLRPISLILFTGDFASKHPKEDFNECFLIIQDIVNSTIRDFSRLCIIPGNHDIYWDDFKNLKLSNEPCRFYYDFLERVYSKDFEVISSLVGFNTKSRTFDEHFDPDSFCWKKTLKNMGVEILGLNTVPNLPELQGLGKVSDKTLSFIKNQWQTESAGEKNSIFDPYKIKIALLHHNILPPFSINRLDESKNILNAGEVIELLTTLGCNVILSGHCHDSYLYKFSYSVVNHYGFSEQRNLSYISTGTVGGYTGSGDRAKSFNIINIFASHNQSEKNIIVTPYLYDSREHHWINMIPINSTIEQRPRYNKGTY